MISVPPDAKETSVGDAYSLAISPEKEKPAERRLSVPPDANETSVGDAYSLAISPEKHDEKNAATNTKAAPAAATGTTPALVDDTEVADRTVEAGKAMAQVVPSTAAVSEHSAEDSADAPAKPADEADDEFDATESTSALEQLAMKNKLAMENKGQLTARKKLLKDKKKTRSRVFEEEDLVALANEAAAAKRRAEAKAGSLEVQNLRNGLGRGRALSMMAEADEEDED